MDPASNLLLIGGVALRSCVGLHDMIRGFQSQNKEARALKAEVSDLSIVLEALLDTLANNPTLDLNYLRIPLQRCGNACQEYSKVIEKCTKHTEGTSKPSMRDWIRQKYLQGDITDFKEMLAIHKSTINIALANANLRLAAITPQVLDNFKDMISDTTADLDDHMKDVQAKIDRLKSGDAGAVEDLQLEWQAMLEEKQSTEQGLEICTQLSVQIQKLETQAVNEAEAFAGKPSAKKHMTSGLVDVRGSVDSLVSRLKAHESILSTQLEAISLEGTVSEPISAQLERLQQTKESISQCIQIVSEAGEATAERSNVFEDITLADNSYAFSVSTVNDLVVARRVNLKGRSRHFGGQVTDETVQSSMAALTKLDGEYLKLYKRDPEDADSGGEGLGQWKPQLEAEKGERFTKFGPGRRAG